MIDRFVLFFLLSFTAICAEDCPPPGYPLYDLSLEEAEAIAVSNNYIVRSFAHLAEGGRYGHREAFGEWLPEVNVFANINRTSGRPLLSNYITIYSSTLNFAQRVFDTDAYFDIKESYADYERLQAEFRVQVCEALFQTRVAYYALLLAQEQVAVEENTVALFREQYAQQKSFLAVGRAIPFDVNLTHSELSNAVANYHRAVEQLNIAKYGFLSVLGIDPGTPVTLADDTLSFERFSEITGKLTGASETAQVSPLFSECEIQDWEQIALIAQPEIAVSAFTAEIQQLNTRRQQGTYAPKVNLFANYFNRSGRLIFERSFWSMGIQMDWQLYNGFQRENKIWRAQEDQRAAELGLKQTQLDAKVAVRSQVSGIEQSLHVYFATREGYEVSGENVQVSRGELGVGRIVPVDYHSAVNLYRINWLNLNQSVFDVLQSYFTLIRVTGSDIYNIDQACPCR